MSKDQYIDSLLNSDTMTINFEELLDYSEKDKSENMLVFIAYEFSERIKTPQHLARAQEFMTQLALMTLGFNIECSENQEAQDVLEKTESDEITLPKLTCEVRSSIGCF